MYRVRAWASLVLIRGRMSLDPLDSGDLICSIGLEVRLLLCRRGPWCCTAAGDRRRAAVVDRAAEKFSANNELVALGPAEIRES